MTAELQHRLAAARKAARTALIGELGTTGHWTGQLSSSALSTATAVTALAAIDPKRMRLLALPRKMPSMVGFDLEVTGYLDPGQ